MGALKHSSLANRRALQRRHVALQMHAFGLACIATTRAPPPLAPPSSFRRACSGSSSGSRQPRVQVDLAVLEAGGGDPSIDSHNLMRIRSMSEKALRTRIWKITRVDKLHSFVQVRVMWGGQPGGCMPSVEGACCLLLFMPPSTGGLKIQHVRGGGCLPDSKPDAGAAGGRRLSWRLC